MLIVFGLIAVLFVIGYLVVKRDQKRAEQDRNAATLKQECEDREFERCAAKAASLAALQKTPDDGENERPRGTLMCPSMGVPAALSLVTLEPPWKNNQPKVSCIPAGVYEVVITLSPRFGRLMPHLLNVPNRTEIEFHYGNTVSDTEG